METSSIKSVPTTKRASPGAALLRADKKSESHPRVEEVIQCLRDDEKYEAGGLELSARAAGYRGHSR